MAVNKERVVLQFSCYVMANSPYHKQQRIAKYYTVCTSGTNTFVYFSDIKLKY